MNLSIIIPAYNEAGKIERDLLAAETFLQKRPGSAEVLVVDDGSKDETAVVVQKFADKHSTSTLTFRLLNYGHNRGKGFAIKYGMLRAQGDFAAFVDSGLCVPFEYLERGIEKLQMGFDYAVASRRLPGTKIVQAQPLYRRIGSKIFWIGMKIAMGIEVTDTQCGFKVYRRDVAREIFSAVTTDGFMFDIEALLLAKEMQFKGAEFAVQWSNDGDTRYNPFWGTLRNMRELSRIRLKSFARYWHLQGAEA